MKKTLCLVICLVSLLSLCACGEKPQSGGLKQVVVAIFPQYDFVRRIAGDRVELTMLISPGAEVHSYDPTPRDMQKIQACDLFIYNGGESDAWVESLLSSFDSSKTSLISMTETVGELYVEELTEGMEGENEGEYDEHVWTSPKNAEKIVRTIADALKALDSENADYYEENASAYLAELEELDAYIRAIVDSGARKSVVFGERFPLRYFAEEYSLSYWAAFPGCAAQSEPSAATISFLINKVRDENIPVVFYIEFSNGKVAETIASEAGNAKTLLFHSCHNVTAEEFAAGTGYLELMYQNAENLKEALN